MSVDRETLDRAVEAAARAADEQNHFIHGFQPDDFEPLRDPDGDVLSSFDAGVVAVAPVLFGAGREAGLQEAREELLGLVGALWMAESKGRIRNVILTALGEGDNNKEGSD